MRSHLVSGDDWRREIATIARTPALRHELERVYPELSARALPIGNEDLGAVLATHLTTYGIPALPREQWGARFAPYFPDLSKMCPEAITEAWEAWHRGDLYPKERGRAAFYPKPAELYALALPVHTRIAGAAFRGRRALDEAQSHGKRLTAEERAQAREDLVAQGILTADGKVNFSKRVPGAGRMVTGPGGESPQQMAARLRGAAENDGIEEAI